MKESGSLRRIPAIDFDSREFLRNGRFWNILEASMALVAGVEGADAEVSGTEKERERERERDREREG